MAYICIVLLLLLSSCMRTEVIMTGKIWKSTKSITLDGVDDNVHIGGSNDMNFTYTDSFTLSLWAKPGIIGESALISKSDHDDMTYAGWTIFIAQNNEIIFRFGENIPNSEGIEITWSHSTPSDQWMHILLTYDGSQPVPNVKLYVNGILLSATFSQINLIGTPQTNFPVYLGIRNDNILGSPYQGRIDEVSWWSKALNSSLIAKVYNSGKPTNLLANSKLAKNLEGWWQLGENDTYPNLTNKVTGDTATVLHASSDAITNEAP